MSATDQKVFPARAVVIALPARDSRVSEPAVRAVMATLGTDTTLRQVREALGGGSLRDIARTVKAVRGGDSLAAVRASLPADADLAPQIVAAIDGLRDQVAALRAPASPSSATLDTSLATALAEQEARWTKRFATLTQAITSQAAPKSLPNQKAADDGAVAALSSQVMALEPLVRGIERRIAMLTNSVDADRRERVLPAPAAETPSVGETFAPLEAKLHRLTQTVDAQFGLIRRVVAAVPPKAEYTDPVESIAAAELRGELRKARAATTRLASKLKTRIDQVLVAIEEAARKANRKASAKVSRRTATAKRKTAEKSTATAKQKNVALPQAARKATVASGRTPLRSRAKPSVTKSRRKATASAVAKAHARSKVPPRRKTSAAQRKTTASVRAKKAMPQSVRKKSASTAVATPQRRNAKVTSRMPAPRADQRTPARGAASATAVRIAVGKTAAARHTAQRTTSPKRGIPSKASARLKR